MGVKADKTERECGLHPELSPPGGGGRLRLFGIGLTGLLAGIGYEMATAIFPIFLANLGGGAALLGATEGISGAASRLIRLGAVNEGRRVAGGKTGLLLGCLLSALMGLLAWVTAPLQGLVIRLFAQIGRGNLEALQDRPGNPLRSGLPRAMSAFGGLLGPFTAMGLVGFLSFREIFWVSLIPAFSAVGAVFFLAGEGFGKAPPIGPDASALPPSFRRFLTAAGVFGLGNFAPTLLILRANELLTRDHGPARAASLAVFLYLLHHLFYAGLSYPLTRLSGRFRKRRLLGVGYLLFALTVAGFIFVPPVKSYIGWLPALLFLALLFSLAGIDAALVDSAEGALGAELLPDPLRDAGDALLRLANAGGRFISSLAVGLLWAVFSPTAGFLFAAAMGFLGGLLLCRLPAR